jgi:hypothetical protein
MTGSFAFTRGKLHQRNMQISVLHSQRPPGVFVRTLTVVVSTDRFSPAALTSSAMKTSENTEEESDDSAPADKADV